MGPAVEKPKITVASGFGGSGKSGSLLVGLIPDASEH
jgi:hypothetical protein